MNQLCENGIHCKEVESVPGLTEKLNFRHFSGYLGVTHNHQLHYWFVESQRNPSTAPVLLWMNGGPGCSSLVGFLTEIGPFLVNDDGKTVRLNPYSWNQDINIIFLEAPAGAGYSYSTDGNITTDDDQVARENYAALKIFFGIAFSQYKKNDFYIAGQSYGGVYVPTLSKLIVDGQEEFKINLKGVLIGNGYVDASLNIDTFIPYAYWHGILPKKIYNKLKKHCCESECPDECTYRHESDICAMHAMNIMWGKLLYEKINPYDIYANCAMNDLTNSWHFATMFGILPSQMAHRLIEERNRLKLFGRRKRTPVNSPFPCVDDTALVEYVNQPEFRKALFIPSKAQAWDTCADPLAPVYTQTYENTGMFEQVKHIHKNGIKVLMYNGDTDVVCNYALAEVFAEQLGIKLQKSKKPWYFQNQNAGYVTKYIGLHVYTVKGAGHMAPESRKPEMLYLVNQFVQGKFM